MADSQDAQAGPSKRGRVANAVGEKAQEVIKEDLGKARVIAIDAAKSRAYLYPIKGIFYFMSHKSLWQPFTSRLGPYITMSLSVLAGMFTFTYLPQMAALVFVDGPLAPFTTVLLILNESAAITNTLSRSWLLQDAILDTFDGTLLARNQTAIVQEGREVKAGSDPIGKLGKVLKNPFSKFSPKALVRYMLYLPLNFIPVVGTVIFIILNGRSRGQYVHDRYFQLKKWSSTQRSDWLTKHVGPYTAFGLVATVLEMIPVANMFFTYTNTVGAALWAADIEAMSTSMTDSTAPTLREKAT